MNLCVDELVITTAIGGTSRIYLSADFEVLKYVYTVHLVLQMIPVYFAGCNCFSHTDQCVYNETVDDSGLSLDIHGKYEGGGVCQNCQHNTKGINCDKCIDGYYRPFQKPLNATDVCQRKFINNWIVC